MNKANAARIILILLLLANVSLMLKIQPARAAGTVYIKPDGNVDPPETPIQKNGDIYTFTADISASIIVQKSSIIIDGAGHLLQGSIFDNGIDLSSLTEVTVRNVIISNFDYGVYVASSNHITISGNTIASNNGGIWLKESADSLVSNNLIGSNFLDGIYIWSSSNNNISQNNVESNVYGITDYYGLSNRIFHNNFVNNEYSVNTNDPTNLWDDDYPSGGNYWSDYTGVDLKRGTGQNEAGSDGVGDTAYIVDTGNRDNYPLTKQYAGPHDIGITSLNLINTVIGEGYPILADVKITNYGAQSESFNLAIKANSTTIQTLPVTLTGRNSTTVRLGCPTLGLAKGSYSVSAYATYVLGEIDTSDNTRSGGRVFISIAGDINEDKKVDLKDVFAVGKAYGSRRGDPKYEPNLDINSDGIIDLKDYFVVCRNFGQLW